MIVHFHFASWFFAAFYIFFLVPSLQLYKLVSVGCHKIAFHLVRRSQTAKRKKKHTTEMRYAIYRKRQKTHCHFNKLLHFKANSELVWIFNGQFVVGCFIHKKIECAIENHPTQNSFSYDQMAIYRQNRYKFIHRHR